MFRNKERFMDFYYEAYKDLRKMRLVISLMMIAVLIGSLTYLKTDMSVKLGAVAILSPLLITFVRKSYGLSDLRKFKKALDSEAFFEHVETEHNGDQTLVIVRAVKDSEYLLALRYEIDGVCSDVTCIVK